eukprot:2685508-Ditylum_brightwellii.AAC.1
MSNKTVTPFSSGPGNDGIAGLTDGIMKAKAAPQCSGNDERKPTAPSTKSMFGAVAASAGSYPPLSTKAPTPFTASSTTKAKAAPQCSGSDEKKPTAPSTKSMFGAVTTGAGSYPPLSTKAPTPFTASSANKASTAPSSSTTPFSFLTPPNKSPFTMTNAGSATSTAPFSFSSLSQPKTTFEKDDKPTTTTTQNDHDKKPSPSKQPQQDKQEDTANPHYQKLYDFYKKYNPSKIPTISKTLDTYKNREDILFQKLEAKYSSSA